MSFCFPKFSEPVRTPFSSQTKEKYWCNLLPCKFLMHGLVLESDMQTPPSPKVAKCFFASRYLRIDVLKYIQKISDLRNANQWYPITSWFWNTMEKNSGSRDVAPAGDVEGGRAKSTRNKRVLGGWNPLTQFFLCWRKIYFCSDFGCH